MSCKKWTAVNYNVLTSSEKKKVKTQDIIAYSMFRMNEKENPLRVTK